MTPDLPPVLAVLDASNRWTWDGERGEVPSSFIPPATQPSHFQLLWSLYNLPTPVSGSLGNSVWLRLGDEGLRFEEIGYEGSLGYRSTDFHAWRLMAGHHFPLSGLPWMSPGDRAYFYGGLIRGSGYLDTSPDGKTYSSDAGIGLGFMGGLSAVRGSWIYRLNLDDMGFINWNDVSTSGTLLGARTQELSPHLVAEEQWLVRSFVLTWQEVVTPTGGQGRFVVGYQWLPWLAPRCSVGIDTDGTPQVGFGSTVRLAGYCLNMGLTIAKSNELPVMAGIQTGAAW